MKFVKAEKFRKRLKSQEHELLPFRPKNHFEVSFEDPTPYRGLRGSSLDHIKQRRLEYQLGFLKTARSTTGQ